MLVNASPAYQGGRRHLAGSFCGPGWHTHCYVHFAVHWNPPRQKPHMTLSWGTSYWFKAGKEDVVACRVVVVDAGQAGPRASAHFRPRKDLLETQWALLPPVLVPGVSWVDFFTVCRFVAAGRAPKQMIPGWLEDNAPEPYNRLAGDDPVECIRRLLQPYTLCEAT